MSLKHLRLFICIIKIKMLFRIGSEYLKYKQVISISRIDILKDESLVQESSQLFISVKIK
jgi:hypothetical protein